jgi:hypothetical protein
METVNLTTVPAAVAVLEPLKAQLEKLLNKCFVDVIVGHGEVKAVIMNLKKVEARYPVLPEWIQDDVEDHIFRAKRLIRRFA